MGSWLANLLVVALTATAPVTQPATAPARTDAAVIVLDGQIDDFNRDALFKRFEKARELNVDTIILKTNTYGGLVTAGLDISRFIKQQDDLHVICFVNEKAISAGAMIALACNEIVMEPHALLGDAAPIAMAPGGGAQSLEAAERAKAESPILSDFYDSAVKNGYPPLLAEAMVSVGRVVHWVENDQGERRFVDAEQYKELIATEKWKPVEGVRDPIDAADTLLTVDTDLALKLGLAKAKFDSPESLAAARGLTIVATLEPTGGERFMAVLNSGIFRFILVVVLVQSLYIALQTPGTGMAEAIAVVALGLLLGVPALTGYAQWWEILAVFLGLAFLAVEIFVLPGFGVPGITGVVLILFGLVMTFVPAEPPELPGFMPVLSATWAALQKGLLIVVGGLVCSLLLSLWLGRFLPQMPYFGRLILTEPSGELTTGPTADSPAWPQIGSAGRAVTDLRPSGSAEFFDPTISDSRVVDVVSDSGFIRADSRVIVRKWSGGRVVVRATKT